MGETMDETNERAAQEWQQWHDERVAELQQPHGWLSLVNLEWIHDEPAALASFPGIWSADDHRVTVTFEQAEQVTKDGEPVVGEITFEVPRGESNTSLLDGRGRQAEVASRFGKIIVRTRDPHSQTRENFRGIETYPFDPEWVVSGTWEALPKPELVAIKSAHRDLPMTSRVLGRATFLGQEMLISGPDMDNLSLVFHDPTNGVQTEAWRAAPVTVSGQTATVDFNRAVNFPAHFTPFGTCPTPPEGNTFTTEILAGERKLQ